MKRDMHHPPRVALLVETSLASGRDILRGIGRYVRECGPWSIYHEPRSLEEAAPAWLRTWRGDGIIARIQNRRIAAAVAATRLPAIDVLGVVSHDRLPLVHVDNAAIAQLAADHLLDRGFRHFGYCGLSGINWSDQRRDAFASRVAERGGQCSVYTLARRRARMSWEDEQDGLAAWLTTLPRPVGIMACNDPRGQKVLEACRRLGLKVPEEVAVIGVDNDEPVCEIADPPLSSVLPDPTRLGFEAAKLLDRMIRSGHRPRRPLFLPPVGIVTRQSTDVLAIDDAELVAALRLIREESCEGLSVSDVVRKLSVSRSTLQRQFKAILGRTVHDEIVATRLARAKQLLAETDLPIAAIARRCGFRHQEYLGYVFRTRGGQTPAAYRRQSRTASLR